MTFAIAILSDSYTFIPIAEMYLHFTLISCEFPDCYFFSAQLPLPYMMLRVRKYEKQKRSKKNRQSKQCFTFVLTVCLETSVLSPFTFALP